MQLVEVTSSDTKQFQDLAHAVGWRFVPEQIRLFTEAGRLFGHRHHGRLISHAGLFMYGPLAFLGLVIVHPDYQRRGLGRTLVETCLHVAQESGAAVALIATPAGEPLYRSVGFRTVGWIHRYESTSVRRAVVPRPDADDSFVIQPLSDADWPAIARADAVAYGVLRPKVLAALHAQAPLQRVALTQGHPVPGCRGFAFGICAASSLRIGPLIAQDDATAIALLTDLMRGGAASVRLDVPGDQTGFMDRLRELGFRETMRSPLMVWGADRIPGERRHLYAITDPAVG